MIVDGGRLAATNVAVFADRDGDDVDVPLGTARDVEHASDRKMLDLCRNNPCHPPLVALWETESDRSDWPMGEKAHALRRDAHAVWLAIRDPRTPWYAKTWGWLIAAYALSPIDLIPD